MTDNELKAAAELRRLNEEVKRLRAVIDSRPAINSGLPATYIEWSQSIYEMDMAHAITKMVIARAAITKAEGGQI